MDALSRPPSSRSPPCFGRGGLGGWYLLHQLAEASHERLDHGERDGLGGPSEREDNGPLPSGSLTAQQKNRVLLLQAQAWEFPAPSKLCGRLLDRCLVEQEKDDPAFVSPRRDHTLCMEAVEDAPGAGEGQLVAEALSNFVDRELTLPENGEDAGKFLLEDVAERLLCGGRSCHVLPG